MPKQEILPPQRHEVARQPDYAAGNLPGTYVGGPVEAVVQRWTANRHVKTLDALTRQRIAEGALMRATTNAAQEYVKNLEALARVADTPRRLGHEYALLEMRREEERRQALNAHHVADTQRQKEAAQAEADLLQTHVVLTDAQQQLDAQRDFGSAGYELAWVRKAYETFGVDLSAAERREIVGQYVPLGGSGPAPGRPLQSGELDDALYEAREELRAHGLDTTRIDEIIARRGRP